MAEEVSGCETYEVAPVPLIMNFPRTARYELPVGVTKINVKTRMVTLPDGTTIEMYAPAPMETCKSFLIYTDAVCDIRVSLGGTIVYSSSVFPLWTRSKVIEFDEIEIDTSYPIMFYIAMSNTEDAMASIDPITNVASRHVVSTDPTTDFILGLAALVGTDEANIPIAVSKIALTNIAIMSAQNRNYRLAFYSGDGFGALEYVGNVDFDLPTEGFLLNGYYCMNVHDMLFDYADLDNSYELHMQLVNLDALAKTAGAPGAVKFTMIYGERL